MKDGFKGTHALVFGSAADSITAANWLLDRGVQVTMTDSAGLRRVQGHLRTVATDGDQYERSKKLLSGASKDLAELLPTVDVVVAAATLSHPAILAARSRGILVVSKKELVKLASLPARQEIIHHSPKLTVVNDSGSGSPERAIMSLRQWGGPNCILIAGGDGKGDYRAWAKELDIHIRPTNVILLAGSATHAMQKALGPQGIRTYDSLARAWQAALKRSGLFISSVVLFSPAAESVTRGQEFTALVKEEWVK